MATQLAERSMNGSTITSDKETMYMLGGVAMMIFGAGLILSNPYVRRYLGQIGFGNLAQATFPDIERYLKLRAM